jgi:DNA-binding transcriptional ArsR family regulator
MELSRTIAVLSALAQPTRYRCVEMLVEKGACSAGDLASGLGVPANTMSSHLTILTHAGLVSSTKDGRHVVYRANVDSVADLIGTLKQLAV